ncbi:RNA-directed DNA polymerase, eukaryota [Tanacetum coccineum]
MERPAEHHIADISFVKVDYFIYHDEEEDEISPIPFRMFHYWFEWDGFDKFIVDTWTNINISDNNAISQFMKKLRYLKEQIKMWVRNKKESASAKKSNLKGLLHDLDRLINEKKADKEIINKRIHVMISLQDLEKLEMSEIAQKVKINWSIEGDENSRFFHGMLNKKRNQQAIRGILREGLGMMFLDMDFPNRVSVEQVMDLERNVSKEEIKRAVWDCGSDKSPGPDGFTFDTRVVKDFRPISLIGSVYKIIAKILANRLVGVLGDLIHEVQSAFIANRQILDGPFILDELIHWCRSKNKQAMIFKVDFEKAYDSVRWDYLDDVLNKFGFGSKWRKWIRNCLVSSKGSILVNGSPTSEFYFRKGLKQGDPLSPFLFLLIMESLHLSFQNVVNADMFKGISVSSSLQLSHLFYADDVIFMGQWSESNINTIIQALDCFYKASGLRMNLHKSKLMGISVKDEVVSRAASKMGCSTLKTPFTYLGIKVGGSMARIRSWDEIVDKVKSRLSKWKMNTLSIGGRMTLLKSVLSSTPIYYMSMFKVPSQVLKCLEGIRRSFFIGADLKENKISWFKWNKVLMSKDKGGLGVSSLFALNRALLFKWVWRFHDNRNALWSRFIRALHGNCGGLDKRSKAADTSAWKSITTEVNSLRNKGVDLLKFMNKMVGNGIDTSFWEDIWRGDMNFKTKFPRVYALEFDKKITIASKMNHNDVGLSLRRAPRDSVELEQFNNLNVFLAGTMLCDSNDRWSWSLVGSGKFLVASVRKLIDEYRLGGSSYKTRWIHTVPIKINILAWKVRSSKAQLATNAPMTATLEVMLAAQPQENSDQREYKRVAERRFHGSYEVGIMEIEADYYFSAAPAVAGCSSYTTTAKRSKRSTETEVVVTVSGETLREAGDMLLKVEQSSYCCCDQRRSPKHASTNIKSGQKLKEKRRPDFRYSSPAKTRLLAAVEATTLTMVLLDGDYASLFESI